MSDYRIVFTHPPTGKMADADAKFDTWIADPADRVLFPNIGTLNAIVSGHPYRTEDTADGPLLTLDLPNN